MIPIIDDFRIGQREIFQRSLSLGLMTPAAATSAVGLGVANFVFHQAGTLSPAIFSTILFVCATGAIMRVGRNFRRAARVTPPAAPSPSA